MGEDKSSVLYYNGRPLLNISEMPPITFDSCVDGGDIIGTFPQNRNCSFTATFKHLKMSRKKFVHNLIKQGYSKKWLNSWHGIAMVKGFLMVLPTI